MAERVIIQTKVRKNTHTHTKEETRKVGKTDGEAWLLLDKLHMKEPFKVADTIQLSIIQLETCFMNIYFMSLQ